MSLLPTVQQLIERENLLPPQANIVIAVSGGADSLALLHILHRLAPHFSWQLYVATLNHGLRGIQGEEDAHFVASFANQLTLPVTVGQVDVATFAQSQRLSIEAAARILRYRFLADICRQIGARFLVTGHHADDQAETILLHLLRGSGVTGLRGMALASPLPNAPEITLVRPLLRVSKPELVNYCKTHQLTPRHDTSNDDTALLRNRLRHEIVPLLAQINPNIIQTIARLADIITAEDDLIHQLYQQQVQPHLYQDDARIAMPRNTFIQLPLALQRRFIYHACQQLNPYAMPDYAHINEAIAFAKNGQVGQWVLLSSTLRLRIDYDQLIIELCAAPLPTKGYFLLPSEQAYYAISPPVDIKFDTEGWRLIASFSPQKDAAILLLPDDAQILLRTRQPGDRFAPPTLSGHTQKLKKWLIDQKVPRHVRDRLPLLVVNDMVAAILLGKTWIIAAPFSLNETERLASKRKLYLSIDEMVL